MAIIFRKFDVIPLVWVGGEFDFIVLNAMC